MAVFRYNEAMTSVLEIEQALVKLPRIDRTHLVKSLLRSLDKPEYVSDEEKELLERRSNEVRTGLVTSLSLDELQSRVGKV